MDENKTTEHCLECITKLPVFDSLTEEQFGFLNLTRCRVKFRPGETIFKQGTAMTHVLIVTGGLVKIYLEGIGNRNLILRLTRPVNLIGGPGLFTDFKHHFSSMALEETTACFIDVQRMAEIFRQNKEFAMGLFKVVNYHTQLNYKKLIELTQMGMHGRIAGALIYLHNDVFKGISDNIKINRQDLADLTAMSKESAIRILKEFKDENIISVIDSTIILNDVDKLVNICLKG